MKWSMKWLLIVIPCCLLILALTYFLLFFNMPKKVSQALENNTDYGYQIAAEQNLMKNAKIEFVGCNASVEKIYFDGLRLYAVVSIDENYDLAKMEATLINSYKNKKQASIEALDNSKLIIIWNDCRAEDVLNKIRITFSGKGSYSSKEFEISSGDKEIADINKYFNELFINSITAAKTSTLFDLNVDTLTGIYGFQIETKDVIVSAAQTDKNNNNYKVLFPINVDLNEEFTIYANDKDGFVIKTVPVDFDDTISDPPYIFTP